MDLFPYYLFIFIVNHTHVIDHVSIVHLSFNHFAFQLVLVELTIQLHNSTTQFPFYLIFNFFPLTRFCSSSNEWHYGFECQECFSALCLFISSRSFGWKCVPCRGVHLVRGSPNGFWDTLVMICPKAIFWGSSHLLGFFLHELAFYELTFIQIFRRFKSRFV